LEKKRFLRQYILTLLIFALFIFTVSTPEITNAKDLHLFAAAGLRQPTDQLIELFQNRTGHTVYVDYGGSGTLLARIKASGRGDAYMPAAFSYIEKLESSGRIHTYRKVALNVPVIGVNINKANVLSSFEDLAKPGVRLALGDPEAMAFGKIAGQILQNSGIHDQIINNVVVYGSTVKQLALYVAQGDVDASIIGRADAFQHAGDIRIIQISPDLYKPETISVAVLKSDNTEPAEALELMEFLSSPEAKQIFHKFGFMDLARQKGE